MATGPETASKPVSLLRLLGSFFSPLGLGHALRPLPETGDPLEAVEVRYRNSLFLFRHMDRYINRSAAVVLGCFFAQPVLASLGSPPPLIIALAALLLIAAVHAAALGFYRQILNQRLDRDAALLGIQRPDDRDKPAEFPPPDERGAPAPPVTDASQPARATAPPRVSPAGVPVTLVGLPRALESKCPRFALATRCSTSSTVTSAPGRLSPQTDAG